VTAAGDPAIVLTRVDVLQLLSYGPVSRTDVLLLDVRVERVEEDADVGMVDLGGKGCKIELSLHYEFSSKLLEKFVGPVFHFIASTFVEAFVKRARQLYGKP
jgi:hypothetical protein